MVSDPLSSPPVSHDMNAPNPGPDSRAPAIAETDGLGDRETPMEAVPAHAEPPFVASEAVAFASSDIAVGHGSDLPRHDADHDSGTPDAAPAPVPASSDRITASADAKLARSADALAEFNAKIVEATRANLDATFAFWTSLVGVKTLSEAVELNTQHMRKQIEMLTGQGRELSTLAQKLVRNPVT